MSEARDMDIELKEAMKYFVKKNYKSDLPYYFIDDLEKYLKEKGFDLGCVVQYKVD